ncbi:MAG TPA: MFS transporter [Geminicoccaceae bacterium]|nr:MFS transporter [Geminicoccaceae bacterium]
MTQPEPLSLPSPATRLLLLLLSSLTVTAGATIAPSLPAMAEHFAATPAVDLLSRLVLTLPALLIAVAAWPSGWIIDRLGRRMPLLAGVLLYALAGASGLVLDSLAAILVGRALLGLAVAMLLTATTTLIGDLMPPGARERFLGFTASFMGFGGVVFLTAGGLLAELGWRGPFAVYLLALPLLAWAARLPETGGRDAPPLPGGPFPAALAALLCLTATLHMVIFYLIPVQIPFVLRQMQHPSPSLAGLVIAASTLAGAAASLLYPLLLPRLGHRRVFSLGFSVMALGGFVTGLALSTGTLVLGLVIAGLGGGIVMPNYSAWLMARTPPAARGRAMGGLIAAIFMGQFLSPLLAQPVIQASGLPMLFIAGGTLALGLAALYTLERPPAPTRTEP